MTIRFSIAVGESGALSKYSQRPCRSGRVRRP
jgi:hypothetical protein